MQKLSLPLPACLAVNTLRSWKAKHVGAESSWKTWPWVWGAPGNLPPSSYVNLAPWACWSLLKFRGSLPIEFSQLWIRSFFSSVFLLVFFFFFKPMLTLGENVFKHRSAAFAAALLLSPQRRCSSVKGSVPTGRWLERLASTANMANAFLPCSKPTQMLWVQLGWCELNIAWIVLVLHMRVKKVGWHA